VWLTVLAGWLAQARRNKQKAPGKTAEKKDEVEIRDAPKAV